MDVQIDPSRLLENMEKLLLAHAPSGAEEEVDVLVREMIAGVGAEVWQDAVGSIVIHVRGERDNAPIAATAHKDEIAMIVKRVEEDGRLRVRPVGGLWPWAIGEGPVEVLGREGLVPGVFSVGSKHVSEESPAFALKGKEALGWEKAWVETKMEPAELRRRGVRVGSKAVVARRRKEPWHMGDFVAGYNLDCRAGLAVVIEAALQLREPPPQDVYLVASAEEEIGAHGAVYSVGKLPAETAIAVDVVPVADEYQTRNCGEPVLGCKDGRGVYSERLVQHMEDLALELGFGTQTAVLTSYGSDASIAKSAGVVGRSALIGYPGDNTHGYEICSVEGILNSARLLLAYLRRPLD